MMKWLLILTLFISWRKTHTATNPHQPYKQTWILTDGQTGKTLNETTSMAPLNTWWPDLYFDLRELFGLMRGREHNYSIRQRRALIDTAQGRAQGFWACPGNLKHNWRTCGALESVFCKSCSCVTSNDGPRKWAVGNRDLVNFTFRDPDNRVPQVRIQFNQEQAKREKSWVSGVTWGFQLDMGRLFWAGPYPSGLLTIKLVIHEAQKNSSCGSKSDIGSSHPYQEPR